MPKEGKDRTISIRLSQTLLEALDHRASSDQRDRTQVIREAISEYLNLSEQSADETIRALEKRLSALVADFQQEQQKVSSMEARINELSQLVTLCLKRLE